MTQRFSTIFKFSMLLFLIGFATTGLSAQTVTETFNASGTVSVDGTGNYGFDVHTFNLTGGNGGGFDFTQGCTVTDVNVSVRFAKTAGTCLSPTGGNSYHNETSFRLQSPDGTQVILATPGTWSGSASTTLQTITFDQSAGSIPSGTPSTGTYLPNGGNLNTFNGLNGVGNWTFQAGDSANSDPLCITQVTITVTTAPNSISTSCQNASVTLDGSGNGSLTVNDMISANNNSCNTTVSASRTSFDCSDLPGPVDVTITYTDQFGNTANCTSTVSIIDNQTPTITCSAVMDEMVNVDPGTCSATIAALIPPSSMDNCNPNITRTPSGNVFPVGTTTVTWTATDPAGNSASCTSTVTVIDNESPSITCPGVQTIGTDPGTCTVSNPSAQLTMPTTSDNCTVTSVTSDAPASWGLGMHNVTWTVTDNSGLTNTCTAQVNVVDDEDPTITCPADVTVTANDGSCQAMSVALGTPTTGDNCGVNTVTNNAPVEFNLGTTIVVWTVTDNAGNTATCNQNVTVTSGTTISATTTPATCGEDGSIDLTITNVPGTTTLIYNWSNGSSNEDPTMLAAGDYTVTVTNNFGCQTTGTYTVAGYSSAASGLAMAAACGNCAPTDGSTTIFTDGSGDYILHIEDLPTSVSLDATNACLLYDASVQTCNGLPYLQRQWQINVTNNEGATVKTFFSDAEMNNLFAATAGAYPDVPTMVNDLIVTGFDGLGESCNNSTSAVTYTPTITENDPVAGVWSCEFTTTGFSTFTLHPGSTPLPVEMSSFVGWNEGRNNILNWRTETEENTSHFEILRSHNGDHFERIGNITAVGNSAEAIEYDFVDSNPFSGVNYYKLRIVDFDDSYEFSDIIIIETGDNKGSVKAYPNPFGQDIAFELNANQGGQAVIQIFDMTGKQVHYSEVNVLEGRNIQDLNLNHLANGFYMAKVILPGSNEAISTKIIKE